MRLLLSVMLLFMSSWIFAQDNTNQNKFRQLGQELPTPNVYRTASGAPGHQYWQQEADYDMKVRIDDKTQKLYGEHVLDILQYLKQFDCADASHGNVIFSSSTCG